MIDHVTLRVPDLRASVRFYDLVFELLEFSGERYDDGALAEWNDFQAGYASLGAPGERPHYHPGYDAAYLEDLDGHNVEAVFHDRPAA